MANILAAVMPGPGRPVEVRELPEPELELDSALLDVSLSEVCGTDMHLQAGHLAGVPYPIIPGHVSVGKLRKIRGVLTDLDGKKFHEGDTITFLDVHGTCGHCWYCAVAKASTRCPQRKVYGVTLGAEGLAGGWAQSLYLRPDTRCFRLQNTDAERFMAGGCSLPTALHAVERAEIAIGESVLVLGSGPVGLSVIICALLRGAASVLCIGGPSDRLKTAMAVGASATLDFQEHQPPDQLEWVRRLTMGRGADVTIEATGDAKAVVAAMRCTRDAGRVVVVGQYTNVGDVAFNPHLDLNMKHLDVRGCWGSDFSHFHRAVQVMSHDRFSQPWTAIPVKRHSLRNAQEALAAVAQGAPEKALIDPWL